MRGRRGTATVKLFERTAPRSVPSGFEPQPQEGIQAMSQKLEGVGIPGLSDVEIRSIVWNDGTQVLDISNRALCYEIYFILRHADLGRLLEMHSIVPRINPKLKVETTSEWMASDVVLAYLIEFFRQLERTAYPSTSAILNLFVYATESMTYLADTDGLRSAISTVQGVDPCRQCGSYNTLATTAQTRSADEPETRFVKCLACSASWKEN